MSIQLFLVRCLDANTRYIRPGQMKPQLPMTSECVLGIEVDTVSLPSLRKIGPYVEMCPGFRVNRTMRLNEGCAISGHRVGALTVLDLPSGLRAHSPRARCAETPSRRARPDCPPRSAAPHNKGPSQRVLAGTPRTGHAGERPLRPTPPGSGPSPPLRSPARRCRCDTRASHGWVPLQREAAERRTPHHLERNAYQSSSSGSSVFHRNPCRQHRQISCHSMRAASTRSKRIPINELGTLREKGDGCYGRRSDEIPRVWRHFAIPGDMKREIVVRISCGRCPAFSSANGASSDGVRGFRQRPVYRRSANGRFEARQ